MACGRKKSCGGVKRSCSTSTSLPKPEAVRISWKWTQFCGGSSRFTAKNRHTRSSISCSADICSARSFASHVISLTKFWNRSWTSVCLFRKKSHRLPAVTSEAGPKPADLVFRHRPLHLSSSQNTKGRKNGLVKSKVIQFSFGFLNSVILPKKRMKYRRFISRTLMSSIFWRQVNPINP